MHASLQIDIDSQDFAWPAELIQALEQVLHRVLDLLLEDGALGDNAFGRPIGLSVTLVDDAEMQRINREYRQVDRPTNVLSFPMGDPDGCAMDEAMPLLLGDLVMARETLLREALEAGRTPEFHIAHLAVHGLLHLLDYDHERSDGEAEKQEAMEASLLTRLGFPTPYPQD
ncbi:MAG: rRNA maturation RNase YbeY [Magnetococcales bacterium]|nr:rRNA maturation RNase YbeY [Magnetococcales bacterium]